MVQFLFGARPHVRGLIYSLDRNHCLNCLAIFTASEKNPHTGKVTSIVSGLVYIVLGGMILFTA